MCPGRTLGKLIGSKKGCTGVHRQGVFRGQGQHLAMQEPSPCTEGRLPT